MIDEWTGGHDGNCGSSCGGFCESNGDTNRWYVDCDEIESVRQTCGTCGGVFSIGDRVQTLVPFSSGGRAFVPGDAGQVVSLGTTENEVLIEWDDHTSGHTGNCGFSCGGECTASAVSSRWYVDCDSVGPEE